jgi:hypothetical protein
MHPCMFASCTHGFRHAAIHASCHHAPYSRLCEACSMRMLDADAQCKHTPCSMRHAPHHSPSRFTYGGRYHLTYEPTPHRQHRRRPRLSFHRVPLFTWHSKTKSPSRRHYTDNTPSVSIPICIHITTVHPSRRIPMPHISPCPPSFPFLHIVAAPPKPSDSRAPHWPMLILDYTSTPLPDILLDRTLHFRF